MSSRPGLPAFDAPVRATSRRTAASRRGRSPSRPAARRLTRQRRRDTLCVLVLVVLVVVHDRLPARRRRWPGWRPGIFGIALVAYVALLVHLRRLAEERERKLRYLRPPITDLLEWSAPHPVDGETTRAATRCHAAR